VTVQEVAGHGVRFRYPESWAVTDESTDEKVAVTVQSDGTAFWTIAVLPDAPRPERVVESAVAAYRDDYTEIDVYPAQTKTGPSGTVVSREIEFVCLELIAAAHIEAYETGAQTVLILFQASDAELKTRRDVLDAMTASVQVAEDETPAWPDDLFGE
jgi:hypothetical protein